MELPIELAKVVREYSGPLLRYPGEYKKALHELQRNEWRELKEKLSRNDADVVVNILRTYNEAADYCEWISGISPIEHYNESTDEYIDSYQEMREAEVWQRKCFSALLEGIYEKEEDRWQDMWLYLRYHAW